MEEKERKIAEAYHIYNVAGNVWKFTEEIEQINNYRVVRGGSCLTASSDLSKWEEDMKTRRKK